MSGARVIQNQKLKSFIVLLLSFYFFCLTSFSQIKQNFITPVFENISIEDGLPENSVTSILQDYLGSLWLATQEGLNIFDCKNDTFTQYYLSESDSVLHFFAFLLLILSNLTFPQNHIPMCRH